MADRAKFNEFTIVPRAEQRTYKRRDSGTSHQPWPEKAALTILVAALWSKTSRVGRGVELYYVIRAPSLLYYSSYVTNLVA